MEDYATLLYLSLSCISSNWSLCHSVIFKFVIHVVKLKAIPLCYIWICHTFRQAEGYATLLYLNLSFISSIWRLCHSLLIDLSYISWSWRLWRSVIFKFVIHFVKLKTMPLCYIWICYTFRQSEGYATLRYWICHPFRQAEGYDTLLYSNLSYISSSWRLCHCYIWICHTFRQAEGYATLLYLNLSYISSSWRLYHSVMLKFVIHFVKLKAMPLCYI